MPSEKWVRDIKLGSLTLPIPYWCIPIFGVLVILYVAISLFSEPAQTAYSRYLSGKTEESDAAEAYKHFAESAKAVVQQQILGGMFEAKLFQDGCVSVAWHDALSGTPPHAHFIRKITSREASPGRLSSVDVWALSTLNAAPVTPVAPQRGCWNPHPGPFQWHYGDRNGCWTQVWRVFQDGCAHYQWFNNCGNYWDVNQDGSPRVFWTQCRH